MVPTFILIENTKTLQGHFIDNRPETSGRKEGRSLKILLDCLTAS